MHQSACSPSLESERINRLVYRGKLTDDGQVNLGSVRMGSHWGTTDNRKVWTLERAHGVHLTLPLWLRSGGSFLDQGAFNWVYVDGTEDYKWKRDFLGACPKSTTVDVCGSLILAISFSEQRLC